MLVFLVVYANRFLIRRRKKEFGLYLMLGMRTGDVVKIVALESLIVGAASLAVGLLVGFGLSQLLLYVTSALFQADVADAAGFAFVFSADALVQTAAVFAAIFVIAAVLNARTVAKAKLIDLLHAEGKSEDMKLTSLPLSLVLFAASIAIIGVSYALLIDNGLMEPSPQFAAATVLVCVGHGAVLLRALGLSAEARAAGPPALPERAQHVHAAPAELQGEHDVRVAFHRVPRAFLGHHQCVWRHRHPKRARGFD